MLTIIYYYVSIMSIILYVASVQFKKKKSILSMQIGASCCYLIVYLIKGMYSGAAIEIIEEIKNVVFIQIEKKQKKIPIYILLLFLALLIIVSIIFYDGIYSLLPLLINILLFISTYNKNPQIIRLFMLICGVLWATYNIYGGAYIILIGNILEIISAAIALFRYKKAK